jgi:hypothetical protein
MAAGPPVEAAADDQRGADGHDQPEEGGGPGDQIHQGLLADERALPIDQEADVVVEPVAEARRGRAAEDADHRLALQVGAGLPAHPLGPLRRLGDLVAGLDGHHDISTR